MKWTRSKPKPPSSRAKVPVEYWFARVWVPDGGGFLAAVTSIYAVRARASKPHEAEVCVLSKDANVNEQFGMLWTAPPDTMEWSDSAIPYPDDAGPLS